MYERLFLSKRQKKYILLRFTKELIKNSGEYIYTLDNIIKEKEKKEKEEKSKKTEKITEIVREIEKRKGEEFLHSVLEKQKPVEPEKIGIENVVSNLKTEKYEPSLKPLQVRQEKSLMPLGQAKLTIPETRLPEHFQYLKPSPSNEYVDVGKLNPLIKDPMVNVIECKGPDENIVVTGTMGTKNTGIILNKDEINEIVNNFSRAAKIPVHEGVFKVVVGRLIFMAIVSEIIGSRFTIKKMFYEMPMRR